MRMRTKATNGLASDPWPGRLRHIACAVSWLTFLVCLAIPVHSESNAAPEYKVKAAFLFHFAQFAEWPEGTFKGATSPLTFCTLGEDPFRGMLDETVKGKTIQNHPLQVLHPREIEDARACQVLFLGAEEKRRMSLVLAALKNSPTLTVGESENFAKEGGTIGLCIENNKMGFEINLEAAGRAHLIISARLLALAKTVIGKPTGG